MAGRACYRCEGKRAADIHSVRHPEYHPYVLKGEPGLQPMSEGMRNWRKESGYDAAVKAAKGSPCQVVSPVCTGFAEHLHEPLTRGRSGGLRAAVEQGGTIDSCDPCNGYIGENPVWAAEHGFLFSNTVDGRRAAQAAKETRESATDEAAPVSTVAKRPRSKRR